MKSVANAILYVVDSSYVCVTVTVTTWKWVT